MLSIIIPAQNLIIPRYIIYSSMEQLLNMKILDTYLPLIVPSFFGFGLNGGLFIFLFRQYYLRFPKSIEEAAHIDGAGPIVTFFRIALPTAGSTILVCLVLSIVWHWNDYYEPSIFLTTPKKWLLPQVLPDMFARLTASSTGDLNASAEATKYHAGVVMGGHRHLGAAAAYPLFPAPALVHGRRRTQRPCRIAVRTTGRTCRSPGCFHLFFGHAYNGTRRLSASEPVKERQAGCMPKRGPRRVLSPPCINFLEQAIL